MQGASEYKRHRKFIVRTNIATRQQLVNVLIFQEIPVNELPTFCILTAEKNATLLGDLNIIQLNMNYDEQCCQGEALLNALD